MKPKIFYFCQTCGTKSLKWIGRCPGCGNWNTMVEEKEIEENVFLQHRKFTSCKNPKLLDEIEFIENNRLTTGISEFDRILGGGIVLGSFVLIGGEPGIGKSTLMLQMVEKFNEKCLYISGEESIQQTKLRAKRIGCKSKNIYILAETDLTIIEQHIKDINPALVIIDSIQTIFKREISSAPGSVGQIRECAASLMYLAKGNNISIFIIGHVTKDGSIAGPRVVEHMVDTVLYFEGERYHTYRILRSIKNRFGSTNEIGIFEMEVTGLKEVKNPSSIFLRDEKEKTSGSVVIGSMEGTRPLLVELQALVCPTSFGIPRRISMGIEYNRLCLLLAILEKTIEYKIQNQDVYVNVAGGIKITEPAADLGILLAIISSFRELPINSKFVIIGEVDLGGMVRNTIQIDKRIAEASKLGFKKCIIPKINLKTLQNTYNINICGVNSVQEAIEEVF